MMIRFLVALLMLVPSLALAHPNCTVHKGNGVEIPFALKLDMIPKIVYEGVWNQTQGTFAVAEPYNTIWDAAPNGRGLRIPIYAKANQCLGYMKITIEFDGTLWTCLGYEAGDPFLVPAIDQYTFDTFNGDVAVTNYCSVTDDTTHDPKSAVVFQLYYGDQECVMEIGEQARVVTFLFQANQEWPRGWSGWETSSRFSVMCTSFAQPGFVPLDIAMYPHSNFNQGCQLSWGNGVDLWDAETCVIWDKYDVSDPANPNGYCDEADIGDECISCPGCNYNAECNSLLPQILCNKNPTQCLYLVESGQGKPVAPTTWQRVKSLYRDE